ncbi:hypothetical protein QFC24_001099 [Naganishia onofrii]|uniref:Uncharacterized protein n=1 Tax=Naganishia onofrii TaxID=1851511 RepID=A0ACC2XUH1_9TREE|nr:hypothetical protein QFC24_001099 [Naganishia onofrii]
MDEEGRHIPFGAAPCYRMVSAPPSHHDHHHPDDMTDANAERKNSTTDHDAQQQSSTLGLENGNKVLDERAPSPSSPNLKALHISIPPREAGSGSSLPMTDGERNEYRAAAGATEELGNQDADARSTSTPQLTVQPLNRRRSSIPHPPASPTFPPIINGHTHPTPTWLPRPSLVDPAGISPESSSTTPGIPATATHQQNHLHYEYQESPRSPLAWRQTFGEAVRLNTGGAISPALPHTPTPAPAPERRSSSGRQGSVGAPTPEGYFAFASRSGSIASVGVGPGSGMQGSLSDPSAYSPRVAANGVDTAVASPGLERNKIAVAFGPVPTRSVADFNDVADRGAVSPWHLERKADNEPAWGEEEKQLHGLGFETPISHSRSASPLPFESVSLNSSESERSDHEQEQGEGQQGQLSPLPPSSARSKSFNTRSSLGSTGALEQEPTTPRQRQSSSRRVSASSLSATSTSQRSFTKSPGSRRVSAAGGLWGNIEMEETPRETSMSPRRREDGTRSPLGGSVDGKNVDAVSSSGTMQSVPLSREPSTSSRRPSESVVHVGDGTTPVIETTPRLQAPPAIPHDLDPAILAKLSRSGASSMALWAEKGDPVATTAARIAGEGSTKNRLSMRMSRESVRASMSAETAAVSAPSTISMSSDTAGGGQERVAQTHHSFGPSKLDQVRSQTRMVHLPPKSREEDAVHLERWKEMMEHSRAAGESSCTCVAT